MDLRDIAEILHLVGTLLLVGHYVLRLWRYDAA